MEKEHAVKLSKNKADLAEKSGKNKRISDFFTTPDKNLEKQKQKSLFQFFTKSASKEKPGVEKVVEAVNPGTDGVTVINSDSVTTPTNSDKENSESIVNIEAVKDNNENTNKSKKKQLFAQKSGSGDKGKSEKVAKKSSVKDKNKKNKKKKAKKTDEDVGSLSDSVILLSDSSLSEQPAVEPKTSTGMSERSESKSQLEDNSDPAKSSTDVTEAKNDETVSVEQSDKPLVNTDSKLNETEISNENTESKKTEVAVEAEEMEIETDSTTDKNDGLAKCKKTALKGKDMLNLLKEIQSSDVACSNKKKKHKKKHKHKEKVKTDVEVHEIAQSDSLTEEHETLENKTTADTEDVNNEHIDQKSMQGDDQSAADLKLNDNRQSTSQSLAQKKKNTPKAERKSKKGATSQKGIKNDNGPTQGGKHTNLSYDTFAKNLETNEDIENKPSDSKEMSYSEYLEIMEKNETGSEKESDNAEECKDSKGDDKEPKEPNADNNEQEIKSGEDDNEEAMDCEEIVVDDESNDGVNMKSIQDKDEEKPESAALDRKQAINNFFKKMTSTPNDVKKGGKKRKGGAKINSVRKDVNKKLSEADVEKKDIVETVEDEDPESKDVPKMKDNSKTKGVDPKMKDVGPKLKDVDPKIKDNDSKVKKSINKKSLLNGKCTQATLSFGKAGLTVAKPVPKKEENEPEANDNLTKTNSEKDDKVSDTVSTKPAKRKPGRPRKSRIDSIDLNTTDSSVFATPEVVRKRKFKRRKETSSDMDSESADSIDRRHSLRKRYKVEAFQMDADRKTPIKIKLKCCPKSSSSGEDVDKTLVVRKQKTTMKQSAALALLDKAKRGKMKKQKFKKDKIRDPDKVKKHKLKKSRKTRNESNSSEDSITRRSSRLEGRSMASMEEVSLENIVISSSDEGNDEGSESKKVRKKGRSKKSVSKLDVIDLREKLSKKRAEGPNVVEVSTPTKDKVKKMNTPKKNTPKKSGMKLAPMFLKGKNKADEASPRKPPLDPEQAKQRQQFLMSGVPEALRKQTATRMASLVDADYPPFPKDNHVIQKPDDTVKSGSCNVWDLGHVELPQRCFDVSQTVYPVSRFTGDLMNSYQPNLNDMKHFKNFSSHEKLTSTIVENCLKEIQSYNPLYPTEVMYKTLLDSKAECEKPPVKSESMLKTDMKGILDGCTDMVVIEEEEEKQTKKKKKNLKLQKKEQSEQDTSTKEVTETFKSGGCSLLWTEKYCPIKSSEILGNVTAMKKLKSWLTEWKHVLDREARKARKLLMKKNKGKKPLSKTDDDRWDDDSDFDMDSDDSDDDNSLCNTMLLTGPHGCGKTSSVYALALELGFKVHEVNASSCRSGKHILSQLQEATQSHQVTTQGSLTPRKNAAPSDLPKADHKMPQSFTNLFKKASQNSQESKDDGNKIDGKDGGKKRKRRKSEKDGSEKSKKKVDSMKHKAVQLMIDDSNSQSAANCLNLSSTTLILFDEVDVVFDEDKGFLSAIQNFMSKTKIPILLTTADPGFTHTFDGRYETMNLKRPSMASMTTHLQMISLVENIRVEPDLLLELVQLYQCDVRKCLTMLQFIVLSGGGHYQTQKSYKISDLTKTALDRVGLDVENSQCSVDVNSVCKPVVPVAVVDEHSKDAYSDDDFVVLKPLKKRRRVLDDESNSMDSCASRFSVMKKPDNVMTGERPESGSTSCSTVHCIGVETLLQTGNLSVADTLTQGLKSKSCIDLKDMVCISCCIQRTTKSDVFYDNLHLFLPFSYKIVDTIQFKETAAVTIDSNKSRKRIKLNSDLYDSEASNDSTALNKATIDDSVGDSKTRDTEKQSVGSKDENLCLVKSLSSFTKFYDTLSCLDVLESNEKMKIVDDMQTTMGIGVTGQLVPGVDNQLPNHRRFCETDLEVCETYSSEIKARSVCKFYQEMEGVKQSVDELSRTNTEFDEHFVLPVKKQCDHFSLTDRSGISVTGEYRRACDNVKDHLPLIGHTHQRTRHLDYLPTLREICRSEQCRQITNTKRRFHHYFDGITLSLKEKTMSTLATTFV